MLFSSIPFLYTFLPCVLILYFLVPGCLKNTVLLLSSLFFYAWGEPRFVVFMVIAIVQGYVFGLLAEKFRDRPKRAKLCLWASAAISLGLLCYCKYADFFISGFNTLTGLSLPLLHVALPIGISFYTFQILSYVIDVYRGDVTAQRNLIDLAAYVAMFPQLIAGPIVRYADIAPQLKHRTHTLADAAYGARPLRRAIQRLLEDPLSEQILEGKWQSGSIVDVDVDESGENLEFKQGSGVVPAPRKRDSIARDAELLLTNYDLGHAGLPSAGSGGGTASGGAAD